MLAPEKRRPLTRLLALLILLTALLIFSRAPVPVKASVCCGECDSRQMICFAHCPGSGGNGCQSDCQTQFDACQETCVADPCY